MSTEVSGSAIVSSGLPGETRLSELPRIQQDVALLMRYGEATAEELCASLSLAPAAVHASLRGLMNEGFVVRKRVRSRRCPRQHLYRLTPKGMLLLVVDYSGLCRRLLRLVEQRRKTTDAELGDALIAWPIQGGQERAADDDLLAEVNAVAEAFRGEGFLTCVLSDVAQGPTETSVLEIYHCPILDLARAQPAICRAELKSLSEAFPDTSVRRIRCLREGKTSCSYILRREVREAETQSCRP